MRLNELHFVHCFRNNFLSGHFKEIYCLTLDKGVLEYKRLPASCSKVAGTNGHTQKKGGRKAHTQALSGFGLKKAGHIMPAGRKEEIKGCYAAMVAPPLQDTLYELSSHMSSTR